MHSSLFVYYSANTSLFQYKYAIKFLQVHIVLESACSKIQLDCQDITSSSASIVHSAQSHEGHVQLESNVDKSELTLKAK